jgi:hypothetical protein
MIGLHFSLMGAKVCFGSKRVNSPVPKDEFKTSLCTLKMLMRFNALLDKVAFIKVATWV